MRRLSCRSVPEHEQPARRQRLLLQPRHLRADLRRPRVAFALARILDVGELLPDAHVGVAAELDVGAAAGHVGGDGHRPRHPRLPDDVGLLLVVAGIEDGEHLGLGRAVIAAVERGKGIGVGEVVLLPARLAQPLGQLLRLLDRRRAHQHRLALLLALLDQDQDRAVFLRRRAVDLVVVVDAHHRLVGRHLQHFEIVDVEELVGFRQRRAGHAGELLVHAEIVLERDRRQRLVLRLDRLALLGLQGLVQPFRIAPPRHHAAGELVDDHDLAVTHDVVLVALEQLMRPQGLVDVVDGRDVLHVVERVALEQLGAAQHLLHLLHAGFGQRHRALFLVDLVVGLLQLGDVGVDGVVELGAIIKRTGDDQRGPGLVDQDRVDFVHDGEDVPALDHVLHPVLHVVAQVVEAELVVGAVGDVGVVGDLALLVVHAVDDDADLEAEEIVDLPHPFGIALGEVVVHRHHVHAAPGERVQIDRQRRHQRLAFAGLHLRDAALVQDHAADELDVEMPLPERALRRPRDRWRRPRPGGRRGWFRPRSAS